MPINVEGPELASQYWEPVATGPVAQADLSTWAGLSAGGVPGGTIGAGGNYTSGIIVARGWKAISVGATLNQTGTITIQRFLDLAGTIPVGALVSVALVASTPNWATINDGIAFQSFKFVISNTSGSLGTLSGFGCLLNAA